MYTHTYMCFGLTGPLRFPVAIFWLYLCNRVGAHHLSVGLSTAVCISFPCLHVAIDCQGEERDLLCEPSVTTDVDGGGGGKEAGNSRSVFSSANLFPSPPDVRHEIDSLRDAISFLTSTEAEKHHWYQR